MTNKPEEATGVLDSGVVDRILTYGPRGDQQDRIASMEKELARLRKNITEQSRLDLRVSLVQSGYEKLQQELGKSLNALEWKALDGAYLFLHDGKVDLVRQIPSATSKGEDHKLLKDLDLAEAMKGKQPSGK